MVNGEGCPGLCGWRSLLEYAKDIRLRPSRSILNERTGGLRHGRGNFLPYDSESALDFLLVADLPLCEFH